MMPGAEGQQSQRTTFRPPWVKESPPPIPVPTAPWTLNSRRDSKTQKNDDSTLTTDNTKTIPTDDKQKTKQAFGKELKSRENGLLEKTTKTKPQLERQIKVETSNLKNDQNLLSKVENMSGAPTMKKCSSRANIPPPPPPRPPPEAPSREILKNLPLLTDNQKKVLDMLKSRPRKRPDWACMMKDIESGKKLRHVTCNDRSAPLIERVITKVSADPTGDSHFVFDSEKSNVHNKLLKQIQEGVKLKSVKTNDRSKPVLDGLKKFRRQLTIEEQIQKAEQAPVDEVIPDEMDDIDAVRDDLQSTKQMLALELKNKEFLEKENKKLQAIILNLEVKIEQDSYQKQKKENRQQVNELTESLKNEIQQAKHETKTLESNISKVTEERDELKNELEKIKKQYFNLEKRMKAGIALAGCPSSKDIARIATQKSLNKTEFENSFSDAEEEAEKEEEKEEEEEDNEENHDPNKLEKRRIQKEIKHISIKLDNLKNKMENLKKERQELKNQIKSQHSLLKEEKKKFSLLQKEVDKMAKLMADTEANDDDVDNDDGDDENDETESEEDTESEEESESEKSVEDEISNSEEIPMATRKINLQVQVEKHERRVAALKKGNYLLKAQVDRLKNDLIKQKENSLSLQEDLDSVLAELG